MPTSLAGLCGMQGRDARLQWVVWLRAPTLQVFLSQKVFEALSSGQQVLLVYFSRYSAARINSPLPPEPVGC